MIGFLRGKVFEMESESLTLDVQGVGYEILCSAGTLDEIRQRKNETLSIWIYTYVREDQLQLFGFTAKEEKSLFLSLLKVNGVGPKSAMGILSGASWAKIYEMIEKGDARGLTSLPKLGKKTAEQIILTLQGKLVRVQDKNQTSSNQLEQISFALVNLGFKGPVVESFLNTLPVDIEIEEGVRLGLSALSKN